MSSKKTGKTKRDRIYKGVISVTMGGKGYVAINAFDTDIEISHEYLNTALDGDVIEVALHSKKGERYTGVITKVLERAKTNFVGTLKKENGKWFLIPDNPRIYADIELIGIGNAKLKEKNKALVTLKKWEDPRKSPEGVLVHVLGPAGEHAVEMDAIVLGHGFSTAFPKKVLDEARHIQTHKTILPQEIAKRRDFRSVSTFTIDPSDAKDFDDALSVKVLGENEIEIGIHIADVSHFVRPGNALDKEAAKRATSVYLVDQTIPMLPEALSNDVCSLNPKEEKLTFSAVFVLDQNATVKKQWFGKTIIKSNKRFTYLQAQNVIDSGEGEHHKELSLLFSLSKKLRTERVKEGAIDFDQDEIAFRLNESGIPLSVYVKERLDTHKLVEEFMLLANRNVATYWFELSKKDPGMHRAFIYRIHDTPDSEKLEELAVFLRALGYQFDTHKGVSGKNINTLFKKIAGTPEESLIKTATVRAMAKAVYATKNIGHFGLAFKYYTHFTSPIRRYPDLLVHRILGKHLHGEALKKKEIQEYNRFALESSQREIEATMAERDSIKYKQVEYMLSHVGETFSATITGVTERGLFVAEKNTRAEGLIRMRALGDDYYEYIKKEFALIGKRTKKKYRLGDTVSVRLTHADLETKMLDYTLA